MDTALLVLLLIFVVVPAIYWSSDLIAKLFRKWDDYSERAEAREAEEASRPQTKHVTKQDVIMDGAFLVLWLAVVIWLFASSSIESSQKTIIIIVLFSALIASRVLRFYDLYKRYRTTVRKSR